MDLAQPLYKPALHRFEEKDFVILLDPQKPNWAAVNKEGDAVLSLCNGNRTVNEIIKSFEPSFGRDAIISFIKKGLEREIIGVKPFNYKPYTGREALQTPIKLDELWLYLTNKCNLRCTHCLVRGGETTEDELSTEVLKEIAARALTMGARRVFITGGEPLIRKDALEIIEYLSGKLALEVVLMTNGTLLNPINIQRLCKVPGLVVQVSLEGPNPDTNDSIRGKGSFDKALVGIKLLKSHGVRTIVTSTAAKSNLREIPIVNKLLGDLGIKTHHVLWIHDRGRAREYGLRADVEEVIDLMKNLSGGGVKVDNWESYKARVWGGRGRKVDGCNAGLTSLCLNSNGDVYPCPSLVGEKGFVLGRVEDGLEEVWRKPRPVTLLTNVSVVDIPACRDCPHRFFCGGGCRCQAYYAAEPRSILAKDPYCKAIKEMLIQSMKFHVGPDGHGVPEFLGQMEAVASICDETLNNLDGSASFHCSCVLDIDKLSITRERYGEAAFNPQQDLCCPTSYSTADLKDMPKDTISISYGCGNPTAFADLQQGEVVLDIGSGGGIDCFIAAKKVGRTGRVIGIDMTDEMLEKAEKNNEKISQMLGYDIVEFKKGYIEELPIEEGSIDLVISNCVINLSPHKERVFTEIYRVLKKGGRFSISDIVSDRKVPAEMKEDEKLWSGCISGAIPKEDFLGLIKKAGFRDLEFEKSFKWKEVDGIAFYSLTVKGRRPKSF